MNVIVRIGHGVHWLVQHWRAGWMHRRRRRAAIAELKAMSDAHLRDVGLRRDRIEAAVDGVVAAEYPVAPPPAGPRLRLVASNAEVKRARCDAQTAGPCAGHRQDCCPQAA